MSTMRRLLAWVNRSSKFGHRHLPLNSLPLNSHQAFEFTAHPAYALGNDRVSCAMCVLANSNDIANGAEFNPEVTGELAAIEAVSGYTFTQKVSIEYLLKHLPPAAAARAQASMAQALYELPAKNPAPKKRLAVGTTGDLFAGLEII